jgi:hypothetical protein
MNMSKEIVKSTPEGKLYISKKDFWDQTEIVNMVNKLIQYEIKNGKIKHK